jgi:hypothetical protein
MSDWPPFTRCSRCGSGHPFGTLCPQATDDDRVRHTEATALAVDLAAIVGLIRQGDAIEGTEPSEVTERAARWLLTMDDAMARQALILAMNTIRNLVIADPESLFGALGLVGAIEWETSDD